MTGPDLKIGNYTLGTSAENRPRRMTMLLWGLSKCGKTTLAATAPGKKLWISFDPECTAPLDRKFVDFVELDLSAEPDNVVMSFREVGSGMCRNIDKFLAEHQDIETVVFDSCTTFGNKALSHGVVVASTTKKGKDSTLEDPGYAGYGNKNTWMNLVIKNMLEVTGKHHRHLIVVAHEDKPERNKEGVPIFVSIMLGSSLVQQVPINLSEIWHMEVFGAKKETRIQIRPCRLYKPMGTRMFKTTGEPEFVWKFNVDDWKGEGIADWYERWQENGYGKIELPS